MSDAAMARANAVLYQLTQKCVMDYMLRDKDGSSFVAEHVDSCIS
jgi:hypothetical protein